MPDPTEPAALVDDAVLSGEIPGAVLATPDGVHAVGVHATGGTAVTPDTVFDLASLTKVTATLPCVLHLADAGDLGVDDPVTRYLPDFDGGRDRVTLRHLLSHSSGLPDGRPYYEMPGEPADRWREVIASEPVAAPGTTMVYSDIGFLLLGLIVERVTGAGLDDVAEKLVFAPLGMTTTRYRPPESWLPRIAATEPDADGVPVHGVVHDENARSLGGVCGHAGLFSTAADVSRYVAWWLRPDLPPVYREALRCQTHALGAHRGLGWTLREDRWDHMGTAWPAGGAGHTGFTGTSVGFDRDSGRWAVLLTNAVHLGRGRNAVKDLRRAVHDALAAPGSADQDRGNK